MKILDRYIAFSILRTSLAALVICTLLIIAVNMFSSMNNYVTNSVDLMTILYLAVLGTPEYLMMASSVSFLFGTTFFLSQLESNNEMIMLLNAGISYRDDHAAECRNKLPPCMRYGNDHDAHCHAAFLTLQ